MPSLSVDEVVRTPPKVRIWASQKTSRLPSLRGNRIGMLREARRKSDIVRKERRCVIARKGRCCRCATARAPLSASKGAERVACHTSSSEEVHGPKIGLVLGVQTRLEMADPNSEKSVWDRVRAYFRACQIESGRLFFRVPLWYGLSRCHFLGIFQVCDFWWLNTTRNRPKEWYSSGPRELRQ